MINGKESRRMQTTTFSKKNFKWCKLSGKSIPLEEGNLDLTIESDDIDVDAEELENFFN